MSKIIGYARINRTGVAEETKLNGQLSRLREAGCTTIFNELASGTVARSEELSAALKSLEAGDVLVVDRWDRISRDNRMLAEVLDELKTRGVSLKVVAKDIASRREMLTDGAAHAWSEL